VLGDRDERVAGAHLVDALTGLGWRRRGWGPGLYATGTYKRRPVTARIHHDHADRRWAFDMLTEDQHVELAR